MQTPAARRSDTSTATRATTRRATADALAPPAPTTKRSTSAKAAPAGGSSGGGCDSNYSGCVPVASDVDCAGGSGNGPKFVSGPIRVVGTDKYGLDNDKNGIACE